MSSQPDVPPRGSGKNNSITVSVAGFAPLVSTRRVPEIGSPIARRLVKAFVYRPKACLQRDFPQQAGYMPLARILKEHPFTEGMSEPILETLAALAREVSFDADEIVFRAGERSMYFCLLVRGSACVEIRTPYYGVTIQTLGPGEAFGWSSLLEEHHTVFQVRAREPSMALFLDGEKLLKACREDSKLATEIFRRLAKVVAKRVKATELILTKFCGSGGPVSSPETQKQVS